MLRLFVLAMIFGQLQGQPVEILETTENAITPLFIKSLNDNGTTFEPYDAFDYQTWTPDNSLYEDVPLLEYRVTVDGKQLIYQDFNISALNLEQFKEHYMGLPQFFDADGNFIPSVEEVQAYQASLIAHADDPDATVDVPTHLTKRAFPDMCFYDDRLRCSSSCTNLISRGVRQSVNDNVYGYYHYQSDAQCGTGSITKTVSVTHTSGVTIGGSGQIPGFGKGWTKAASKFLSVFGLTVGHVPDSVTTGISYSGNCGPFNVCFLWERPHFRVDKGVIVTQHIDVNSKRACSSPTVTPYEVHIMHDRSDPGGASSHGICYSMGNHGCGSRVTASSTLQRCPNNY
ncbi:hypothetical protein CI238_01229 [Colletotrichum incanum]|uniref:Uncharacterized protein n=1 Tax=Colletotrichum incanum TaxID=1573173 RepID=A0A161VZM8_COLIC|nr:hypothetical protein CI238_01229 [Colletotrichum incanum]